MKKLTWNSILKKKKTLGLWHPVPSITSWQTEKEKVEAVTDFHSLGSKITADSDCSQEIKRHLLLGRKAMRNLDNVLKYRHHLVDKCPYSQSYGFSSHHVWMRELDHKESWVLKNWCFQTVVLEKTLDLPWTAKRSNQSILKEINTKYSLEGLMLKRQYFCHLTRRADSLEIPWCWERLKVKEWRGNRGQDRRHDRFNGHEFEQTLGHS